METEVDLNIPSRTQLREEESDNSNKTEDEVEGTDRSVDKSSDVSDWTPGSLYLQRKLGDDKTTDDVMYELRSRDVGRSGPELDKDKSNETSQQAGNRMVQPSASLSRNIHMLTHPYNLRSRVGATPSTDQT